MCMCTLICVILLFDRGGWKCNKETFYYPMIISDVSSDEDDSLNEKQFDTRRISYHFTTYDPEKELANQMHRRTFQGRKLKQNSYSQRNGNMMSNSPKKNAVKPSRNKINKSNSQSHRIISNHSVKFLLDEFSASNSESQRTTSIREGNFVKILQRDTKEQIPSVKNNVFSERRTQTEAPQKANQRRVLNINNNESLPKVAYARKLEILNKRGRDIEYLRNILEDGQPTSDLNSLCTYTENDAQVHPLLYNNLSLAGKEKQGQNREVIRPLPSSEEPVLPLNLLGENSSPETICTKSPPHVGSNLSNLSPEKRKTSTPLSLQSTGISFPLSPVKYSGNVDRISSRLANEVETHTENSCNLPSRLTQDIRNHKYCFIMTTLGQKQKNSTDMGYVLLCLHIKLFTNP